MDAWLIANNRLIQPESFTERMSKAVVVHFNLAMHLHHFENHPNNWLFINQIGNGHEGYYVLDKAHSARNILKKVIFISCNGNHELAPFKQQIANVHGPVKRIAESTLADRTYPANSLRSAGYVATWFLWHEFQHIYLLGFTFEGWEGHGWEHEKQFALSNPNKISIL